MGLCAAHNERRTHGGELKLAVRACADGVVEFAVVGAGKDASGTGFGVLFRGDCLCLIHRGIALR